MIHADDARKKIKNKRDKKNPVKIAILDSGVDYNTDMNIKETISLVPGEEEMNPLFMDATGHGTSVAGLVAAKDNKEGITGTDPYAEIYSIRVLDDNNCSPISRVVEGIYMAIDKKVDIINMSFGINTYSESLEKAIKDASKAGIIVVAAAGNTGKVCDTEIGTTVQYPAAFDEVIAVGSVDKRGEVVATSARGDELDLVAPGELVRSTGMFGSELVESGTSLAAPQVAGAAALILEQNKNVTPDFVRELLKTTANSYGKSEEYGAGLLDVDYALDNYKEFKENYEADRDNVSIEQNTEEISVFKDTGCVEGCWSRDNHEKLVKGNYKNVKKGARFPDCTAQIYFEKYADDKTTALYVFCGMRHNPWWHGYFQKTKILGNKKEYEQKHQGEKFSNYVANYIYITRLANEMKTQKVAMDVAGASIKEIKDDLGKIDWKREYGYIPDKTIKRDFIWGMELHSLGDSFAHCACNKKGKVIQHPEADDTTVVTQRWEHANAAVASAMEKYKLGDAPGTFSDYAIVKKATGYKMANLYNYMNQVAGDNIAKQYKAVSKKIELDKAKKKG